MKRAHNQMKRAHNRMKRAHKQMKGAHKYDCGTNVLHKVSDGFPYGTISFASYSAVKFFSGMIIAEVILPRNEI